MRAYHTPSSDQLGSILQTGLKKTSRGDKGQDNAIIKTDEFLDSRRPKDVKEKGISRDDNVYAYMAVEGGIINITDGKVVPLREFISRSSYPVVEIDIDPHACYVSDLDLYDEIKTRIEAGVKQDKLDQLAARYWHTLTPLTDSNRMAISRPEIMITYDVPPQKIRAL